MSGEIVTIHGAAEGVDAFPMFCGPKLPMLAWAVGLESAHILLPGSEWTPCCRDPTRESDASAISGVTKRTTGAAG